MKKKIKLPLLKDLDLLYLLHVALRKSCDSKATSIAWNAINLMENEHKESYINYIYDDLEKDIKERTYYSFSDLIHLIRKSSLSWRDYFGNHAASILACSFDLFSIDDWEGYSNYLGGKLGIESCI